jgi:sortase A
VRQELPTVVVDDEKQPEVAPAQPVRTPRPGLSTNTRSVLWVLLTIGLLALWLVSYARVFSGIEQHAAQRPLYDQLREELAKATAPVGGAIEPGAPVALIDAPAAGIDNQVVIEGTSSNLTRNGPGHRRDTPMPGQAGTSVLMGRSITFGAPFGSIASSQPGDSITITTGQGAFEFTVEQVRRPGDPTAVPLQDGQSRVTLVTSESSGVWQGWAAQSPVFVDALLQGKAVETPTGRPGAVSPSEASMAASTYTLMQLVLWLQLLLVVVVLWVWAAMRWGRWQTWMVAVPAFAAALWGTTSVAFAMLPNLL